MKLGEYKDMVTGFSYYNSTPPYSYRTLSRGGSEFKDLHVSHGCVKCKTPLMKYQEYQFIKKYGWFKRWLFSRGYKIVRPLCWYCFGRLRYGN